MSLTRLAPTLLILTCCNNAAPSAPGADTASAARPTASASVTAAASASPPASAGSADAPQSKHPTVPLPAIAWTKTPSLADAPAAVAVADLDGMHVAMPVAEVRRFFGDWVLRVGEAKTASTEQQVVVIPLKGPPAAGAKTTAAYGKTGAVLHLVKPGGNETISSSGDSAYAVEFTSVDVKPYDKAKKGSQIVGTAKGRLIVMYSLSNRKPSWVAGTFEAPVEIADDLDALPAKKR